MEKYSWALRWGGRVREGETVGREEQESWPGEGCWSPSHPYPYVQGAVSIIIFSVWVKAIAFICSQLFCCPRQWMDCGGICFLQSKLFYSSLGAKCTGWFDITEAKTNHQSLHYIPFMCGKSSGAFPSWDQLALWGLLPTSTNSTRRCECRLLPLHHCFHSVTCITVDV